MARRAACGKPPPTRIGGYGFCPGLGQVILSRKSTMSPWYSALDLVQISFIASIRSRISLKRVSNTVPWSSISSWFQPPPTPNRRRPFDTWSSEATSLAVWIGSRCCTRQTPVPTLSFVVAIAARSEEHTSELQSLAYLVCRLLLEKKKKKV